MPWSSIKLISAGAPSTCNNHLAKAAFIELRHVYHISDRPFANFVNNSTSMLFFQFVTIEYLVSISSNFSFCHCRVCVTTTCLPLKNSQLCSQVLFRRAKRGCFFTTYIRREKKTTTLLYSFIIS